VPDSTARIVAVPPASRSSGMPSAPCRKFSPGWSSCPGKPPR